VCLLLLIAALLLHCRIAQSCFEVKSLAVDCDCDMIISELLCLAVLFDADDILRIQKLVLRSGCLCAGVVF